MSALTIDDDVVRWAVDGRPATAEEAYSALAQRPLLLLMHGFGSFEGDLSGLAPNLPLGFVCASPRAPLVAPPPIVNGFAWWPLPIGADGMPIRQPEPAQFVGSGPHTAALALLEWLDQLSSRVQDRSGAGLGTVALLGFSQGGCMVTSLLRLQPERFVCGVNCSGFVAPGAFDGDARLAQLRPPMFWGRDELDPIIDESRIATTAAWAPEHTNLEARLYDGILHGIGAQELADISAFLQRHVPEGEVDGVPR
jgi:phospholipase/carboxylesterase